MDPTLMAAGANIAGGLVGNVLSQGDRNASMDALQNYYNQLNSISLPDIEKMKLQLEKYQSAGEINPDTEQAIQLAQQDQLQNIQLDPRLRQTQMQQLESLSKLGETGTTPEEQAQLNAMRKEVESNNQARMKSLLENQQSRGVASGEGALAARLLESQAAANRQSTSSDQLAASAFQRALQAKAGASSLAGQLENTDYSRGSDLATALRNRELTNAQQQSQVQQRNIDRFNQAQATNLQNKQNIMNSNTGLANQQQQYNKNLNQTNYENQLKKSGMLGGASSNLSNAYGNRAQQTAGMWSGMGSGIGTMLGAMNKGGGSNSIQATEDFGDDPNGGFTAGNMTIK